MQYNDQKMLEIQAALEHASDMAGSRTVGFLIPAEDAAMLAAVIAFGRVAIQGDETSAAKIEGEDELGGIYAMLGSITAQVNSLAKQRDDLISENFKRAVETRKMEIAMDNMRDYVEHIVERIHSAKSEKICVSLSEYLEVYKDIKI